MSLWITEYIYIPMGGNKKGKKRTLINIMLAMIISGIWHGSTLNFVLWGALHGLAQVIEKYLRAYKNELLHNCKFFTGIGILITFIVVNFLWIPFRTDNLSMTLLVFKRIMTNEKGLTYIYTIIILIILIFIEVYAILRNEGNNPIKPLNLRTFVGKFIFVTEILLILMFAYFGNSAFIYSAF